MFLAPLFAGSKLKTSAAAAALYAYNFWRLRLLVFRRSVWLGFTANGLQAGICISNTETENYHE